MYSTDVHQLIKQHINRNDETPNFKNWAVSLTPLNEEEFRNKNREKGILFKRIDSVNKDQHDELKNVLEQANLTVETEDGFTNVILYKLL